MFHGAGIRAKTAAASATLSPSNLITAHAATAISRPMVIAAYLKNKRLVCNGIAPFSTMNQLNNKNKCYYFKLYNKVFDNVKQRGYIKAMKKPFGIRLGDEQTQILKEIANAEERSVSAVIRRMIDEGIKKKKSDTEKVKRVNGL